MQPDDVQRAVEDARDWVGEKMTGADLVAHHHDRLPAQRADRLHVEQGRALGGAPDARLQRGHRGQPRGDRDRRHRGGAAAATEAAADRGRAFQEFNNDVRLAALKTLCQELAPIQQKKALLYFSAGMSRSGDDNQIELRSATSTCNRGNVTIYPVDTRGLAGGRRRRRGGEPRQRRARCFTGGGMRGFQQLNQSQETLTTLAADTGGRAFTRRNDFGDAFDACPERPGRLLPARLLEHQPRPGRQVPQHSGARRQSSRLKGLRIEARPGYYAGRSFVNTNNRDREAQLDEQLAAAVSSTDMPMVVGTGYFRQQGSDRQRSQRPLLCADRAGGPGIRRAGGRTRQPKFSWTSRARCGTSRDASVGRMRETIKVPSGGAETLAGKQVFYQTGVSLPPGRFSVKVVMRENTGGAVGSFEAPIVVPQLDATAMKVSSVVMSTQVQKAAAGRTDNPLSVTACSCCRT